MNDISVGNLLELIKERYEQVDTLLREGEIAVEEYEIQVNQLNDMINKLIDSQLNYGLGGPESASSETNRLFKCLEQEIEAWIDRSKEREKDETEN